MRYSSRKDLEDYYVNKLGRPYLNTFLIPGINQIKLENGDGDATVKDEFHYMTNWRRVFKQLAT